MLRSEFVGYPSRNTRRFLQHFAIPLAFGSHLSYNPDRDSYGYFLYADRPLPVLVPSEGQEERFVKEWQ